MMWTPWRPVVGRGFTQGGFGARLRTDPEESSWSTRNKRGIPGVPGGPGLRSPARSTETHLYTHCLVCHTPFPPNEELEYFSTSSRVAYDAERGRLWAVCRSCKRWSLAPIEDRWEALEELEKVVKDRAKLLSQTDNIALLRAGELDVVRVGRANLTEEAWWRYGRELTNRAARHRKLTFIGTAAAGAAIAGGWATGGFGWLGAWLLWEHAPRHVTQAARWFRFGGSAWRGKRSCARCGHLFRSVAYQDRKQLILSTGAGVGDALSVTQRCPSCGDVGEGGLHILGKEGDYVSRRLLAYHHHTGASEKRVRSATRLIEEAGSPEDLTRIVIKGGRRLGDLQRTGAIALEIAANDTIEQRLLELELAEVEAHWKEEEELASIIDGELTPMPLMESIRRRVAGIG